MVERNKKKKFTISIFERDFAILEAVHALGSCTSAQVHEILDPKSDLLQVMRNMHVLVDRGLLERIVINKQRLYRVKPNYKTAVRTYFKVSDRVS